MEKITCETVDFAAENAAKLIKLFPECEGERGMVDLDKLRQVLSSSVVDGDVERYQFTWPGKRKAMAAANAATTKTLRPVIAESVGRDGTAGKFDSENLYIEGDNLEALKLLQCNYAGKVKMIYIDPPYNTGKDFIYKDRFLLTRNELESEAGIIDEDGNKFVLNEESDARYHSNWCSMIYPRLRLARNLLADDGIIFISIDDNEFVNLRNIANEIFGESNLVSIHHIQVRYGQKSLNEKKDFQELLEYVLIYAKDKTKATFNKPREEYSLDKFNLEVKHTENPSKVVEENGRRVEVWLPGQWQVSKVMPSIECFKETWISGSILTGTGHGTMYLKCVDKRRKEDGDGCLYRVYGVGEDGLGYRYYTNPKNAEAGRGKMLTKIPLDKKMMVLSGEAIKESPIINFYDFSGDFGNIRNEGGIAFNAGKKPVKMLKQFINYLRSKDGLILDFFSGSASTAHAVMQLNAEDGGNRKFILVQLPEVCAEDSEAAKAGYKNICEIGKERIRRAGKKIIDELAAKNTKVAKEVNESTPDLFRQDLHDSQDLGGGDNLVNPVSPVQNNSNIDVGFRVLKIDSSSLDDVSATVGETNQMMFDKLERIKSDRTPEDILFQLLIETHIPLSDPIAKVKVGGNEVFFVGVEADDFRQDLQDSSGGNNPVNPVNPVQNIYMGAPLVACLDRSAKLTNEFFLELAAFKPGIAFFRDDAFNDDAARINVEQIFKQNSSNTIIKVI